MTQEGVLGERAGEADARARRQRMFELLDGRRLTPAQRRIANCLITHPDRAPFLTGNELADLAHVSQPSVTRFANALGFDTYPQLRSALRRAPQLVAGADPSLTMNEWQRSVTLSIGAMEDFRRQLAEQRPIREAAEVLATSRPLSVLGLRSAGPVAQYFGYFASKVLPDVRAVTNVGTVSMADALEHCRASGGDAMLVYLLPRYPRETVRLMKIARSLGFTLVCITDSPGSPAHDVADQILYAPVESSLVFDSHALPLMLSMVLLEAVCEVQPTESNQRLEDFDRFASAHDLFV